MNTFNAALILAFATLIAALPLQEEMVVEGVLAGVDFELETLSVKTADDLEINLKYTSDTRVVGPDETIQSLKERLGTKVKINYRIIEEKPQAIRIEIG